MSVLERVDCSYYLTFVNVDISDMDTNDKDDSYADIIMNITNRILIMLLSSSLSVNITIVISRHHSSLIIIIIIIIIVIVHSLYPLCLTLRDVDIDMYSYIIIISKIQSSLSKTDTFGTGTKCLS